MQLLNCTRFLPKAIIDNFICLLTYSTHDPSPKNNIWMQYKCVAALHPPDIPACFFDDAWTRCSSQFRAAPKIVHQAIYCTGFCSAEHQVFIWILPSLSTDSTSDCFPRRGTSGFLSSRKDAMTWKIILFEWLGIRM